MIRQDNLVNVICQEPKLTTDWFAWSCHLMLGCIVGFGSGIIATLSLFRFRLVSLDQMILVMVGMSFCCGAFTSFYGNQAWMMPSMFSRKDATQGRKAKTCSLAVGTVGFGLILAPIFLHLHYAGLPTQNVHSLGFGLFILLLATLPGILVIQALRTGDALLSSGVVNREDTPLRFWIYIVTNAITILCIVSSI